MYIAGTAALLCYPFSQRRMLQFWKDIKSAQFVDYQTRVLSFTLPVRANHVKIKNKLTMMLQLTSTGGVLPSFELQSRVDTVDYEYVFTVLILNLSLVIMFIVNELIEAYDDGFVEYFSKSVHAIGTLKRKRDACTSPHHTMLSHTLAAHTLHFSPRPTFAQYVELDGLVRIHALYAAVR